MRYLTLELRKSRRTGVYVILPLVGILGALYAFLNFALRRDALLALPLPPMTILLTQLYGMIMVLNLFAVTAAACLSYHHEFLGNGLKKMAGLPVSLTGIFLTKFIFLSAGLALCILIENAALALIGTHVLPPGTFKLEVLIQFSVTSYLTTLPLLAFMLTVSSRFETVWMPLGIGVVGFLSGMTMAMAKSALLTLNPFVLIMRPAMGTDLLQDPLLITTAAAETIIFFGAGWLLTRYLSYE